jgi:DNA adenine methylase
MTSLRSPLPWIGGKYYSAQRILGAFPPPQNYDVYVELFGGAAHVLIQKPRYKHIEVYNDITNDLVNFWLLCRDHGQELEERCRSLPYARSLYYVYHRSLFDGTPLEPLERAARWFYVLRSNFSGRPLTHVATGWSAGAKDEHHSAAHSYHTALDLFPLVQQRLQRVMIDNRDFAEVFKEYSRRRVLFYVDPPYIGCEKYYQTAPGAFTLADHQRLAILLNNTSAYVALSYYPHHLLDDLYPSSKWRRTTWRTTKHSQRTKETRDAATELLLTNYAPGASLWDSERSVGAPMHSDCYPESA